MNLPPGPLLDKAQTIARAAAAHGGRALLVGGWVRDALLGQSPKDADIEVFGIEPDELRRLLRPFGKLNCVGESFRVYKLAWHQNNERLELDISVPRRDRKTGDGHRGFEIEGDPHASFEDAARRRDFTINAIGCDPLTEEILDPFDGRADLEKRILRAVDAAHFGEDSLRVLRAMQFAARFDLQIEPRTIEICRATPLSDLPRERIWMEWEKLLLKAQRPSLGLQVAEELRVLEKLHQDVAATLETHGQAFLALVNRAAQEKSDLPYVKQITLMLAVMDALWRRDAAYVPFVDEMGIKKIDGYDVRATVFATQNTFDSLAFGHQMQQPFSDGELRALSLAGEPVLVFHFARAHGCDELAAWFKREMTRLDVWTGPPTPLLQGRHVLELGLKPGPRIGEITRAVYEKQLDGAVTNLEEARAAALQISDIE